MVTKEDIVRIAKRERLPLGIVEKDYVLTYVLKKIYGSELRDKLVFKGGTALHKLYLHERMSIDLDFTVIGKLDMDEIKPIILDSKINSKIKDYNETKDSLRIVLSYTSVLSYPNYIILDLSKRERPILDLANIMMKSWYFDDIEVKTFQVEELIAEKLRAMMHRKKPRDYLDIYYITEQNGIDWKKTFELARKKLQHLNEELDTDRLLHDTDVVKLLWKQDLVELVIDVPSFDQVLGKIKLFMTKNAN